jgi:hypothetical protein
MFARFSAALSVLALATACSTVTPAVASHGWTHGYTACITEDSPGPCYWDAAKRGNGSGRSFLVNPDQKVIYVSER